MDNVELFLETPVLNLVDLNISKDILLRFVEIPQMDLAPIDLHVFDIESEADT